MATPYQKVAKEALINWNGLSEEEATVKIMTESVPELDSQVGALPSVGSAILGITKELGLSMREALEFFEASVFGPEDAEIFEVVRKKAQDFSKEQILEVLAIIHNGWVEKNSDEKTINKKIARKQLRQYAPIELIGWNEVKSDLLFLRPVLEVIGVSIDEETLKETYHTRVSKYMDRYNLNSIEDLTSLIKQGRAYYPVLSEELEESLLPRSEEVATQMYENWGAKDQETAQIFANRKKASDIKKPKTLK